MKKQKIKTVYNDKPIDNLYFVGGYVSNYRKSPVIINGNKQTYDTIYLSTEDDSFSIMVFHQICRNGPLSQLPDLIYDAYIKHVPIACVFTDNGKAKAMCHVYTNFTAALSTTETYEDIEDSEDYEDNDFTLTLQEKKKLPF